MSAPTTKKREGAFLLAGVVLLHTLAGCATAPLVPRQGDPTSTPAASIEQCKAQPWLDWCPK